MQSSETSIATVSDADFASAVAPGTGVVAVDFWAQWCGPCKMMTPVIEAAAREFPGVRFFAMDTDANPATMVRLGVRGLPTTLVFRDGEIVDRIVGAVPARAFNERLAKHLP